MKRHKSPSVSGGGSSGGYRFKITIDHTKVSGDLTNFVFLFSENIAGIPADFWTHIVDTTSGLDIRFRDSDEVTELKRQIHAVDTAGNTIEAWVQVPAGVNDTTDKEIWCYYGGSTLANDNGVWTNVAGLADGVGIYHMNDPNDSSPEGNNGTSTGTSPVAGKIGQAQRYLGSTELVSIADSASLQLTGKGTLSAWYRLTDSSHHNTMIGKGTDTFKYGLMVDRDGKHYLRLENDVTYYCKTGFDPTVYDGVWRSITATWDIDAGLAKMYLYGELNTYSTNTYTEPPSDSQGKTLYIGNLAGYPSIGFEGDLDEVRILDAAIDADTIASEYANQNDPATFADCDVEENMSGGTPGFRPGQIRGPCN